MRKTMWALSCVLCAMAACADSTKDAVNAFRDSLLNKQLLLRNFSGEEDVHATWTGKGVVLDSPRWQTLGEVEVKSVKLKRQTLVMECSRRVLVKDDTGQLRVFAIPVSVKIEVNLGGSDPT